MFPAAWSRSRPNDARCDWVGQRVRTPLNGARKNPAALAAPLEKQLRDRVPRHEHRDLLRGTESGLAGQSGRAPCPIPSPQGSNGSRRFDEVRMPGRAVSVGRRRHRSKLSYFFRRSRDTGIADDGDGLRTSCPHSRGSEVRVGGCASFGDSRGARLWAVLDERFSLGSLYGDSGRSACLTTNRPCALRLLNGWAFGPN